MEELLSLLASDPKKAIETIKLQTKPVSKISEYIKEYKEFNRLQREGQIEKIQIDKSIGNGQMSKMVKIYLNHAQNIVETLSAFVIGKPVTLIPSENNDLAKLVKQIWRVNRIDSKLLEATILKLSETQVAMQFYIADSGETSLLNKVLAFLKLKTQLKEIKAKVLDNTKGVMTPYFDTTGNMIAFMWEYKNTVSGKEVNNVEIWDSEKYYYLNDAAAAGLAFASNPLPHGFDRIPVVYDSQLEPQWYTVKSPIDRHEVALSKLGDANDYSGHPILVTEGEVENMPLKSESGKHFNIPIKLGGEDKKTVIKGDVRFLEATTAPESNKLELDKLEDAIAYGSGIPNLSLEKLKSLGNVAEKTVKLMFLATDIKASLKQMETRTFIERCLNIIVSGVTKTTNTSMATAGKGLYYDIQFNSILPSDIKETVDTLSVAVAGKLMSRKTSISMLDLVEDVDAELALIEEENKIVEVVPPVV
jgi:SPP1 family phage portal protein